MKRNIITLVTAGAIALGGFALAEGQDKGAGGWHGHARGNPLDHLTQTLALTADQQAKVKPIIDQATPQIQAIHQEAMQRSKAVMDNTMAQIRPLLTPDQQKKLDAQQQAHQDMHKAVKELHDTQSN